MTAMGASFVETVTRMMILHMCDGKLYPERSFLLWLMIPLCLLSVYNYYNNKYMKLYPENINNNIFTQIITMEELEILYLFIYAIVASVYTSYCMINVSVCDIITAACCYANMGYNVDFI